MSMSSGAEEKGDLSELKQKGNLSEEEINSILKQMLAKETKKEKVVLKKGNWSSSEENEIMQSIQKACSKFPADLDKQVSLMHFSLELSFGKRIQIFIYNKKCTEGHCLYAIDGKYVQVQYNNCIYIVWKVKLIEDQADEKQY